MRRTIFCLTLIALATGVALPADAAGGTTTTWLDSTGVREYWTPARLARAEAAPMPRADIERLRGDGKFIATNVGGLDLHYSSSRLLPEDSRLLFPLSPVGRLFFSIGSQNFVCSGAVISARVVLTAGHCVYSDGDFHDNFLFIPAYHQGDDPFGSWTPNFVGTTDSWADTESVPNDADVGVLVMNDQDIAVAGVPGKVVRKIGQVTGWLGYLKNKTSPNHLHQFGYPVGLDGGERMHQAMGGESFGFDDADAFCYGSDMRGGASGGPMVQNFGIKSRGQRGGRNKAINRVVGVNSFTSADASLRVLCTSGFDNEEISLINAACADSPGNCQRKGKPKAP